jgi:hypothetical protein
MAFDITGGQWQVEHAFVRFTVLTDPDRLRLHRFRNVC